MADDKVLGVPKFLGVLGGMGPLASAQFMTRLTLLTPAERDQDHIPAVLWSDPRVPDRTRGKLSGGDDPLPWLLRGIRGTEKVETVPLQKPLHLRNAEDDFYPFTGNLDPSNERGENCCLLTNNSVER